MSVFLAMQVNFLGGRNLLAEFGGGSECGLGNEFGLFLTHFQRHSRVLNCRLGLRLQHVI